MTHPYVIWLIHMWYDSSICDMTHPYVIWLIHMWYDSFKTDMTICLDSSAGESCQNERKIMSHVWHDSFLCNMTHSQWHDSFICDMTYSYVTWLIHIWYDTFICDMTHSSLDSARRRTDLKYSDLLIIRVSRPLLSDGDSGLLPWKTV